MYKHKEHRCVYVTEYCSMQQTIEQSILRGKVIFISYQNFSNIQSDLAIHEHESHTCV